MPKGVFVRGPVEVTFWTRVKKKPGCWEWIGTMNRNYGRFRGDQAHRVAYQLQVGPIPDGMLVCHKCDNPKCVRPSHLFLGTYQDNMSDKVLKGRQSHVGCSRNPPKGEKNPKAKLTEDAVREIRRLVGSGMTLAAAGRMYGVRYQSISSLIRGDTWSHVD